MNRKIASILVCLTATMFGASTAHAAFEGLSMMRMGAWEVDFSGNVNAYFTNGECNTKRGGAVAHGLACGGDKDYGDVRDGLLPSWFNMSAATMADNGIRTAIHLSFQPGTGTDSGLTSALDGALGLNSANYRQVFLTFGTEEWGTIKLGRDLGVFGSDAILNDMTLLGVGSGAYGRGHTTLGRIGVGYLYADWKAQVQYTSPNFNGLTFTAAIVDPWGTGTLAGAGGRFSVADTGHDDEDSDGEVDSGEFHYEQEADTYGFEAKLNYNTEFEGGSLGLWAGYIRQEIDYEWAGTLRTETVNEQMFTFDDSADADAYEIGGKLAFGSLDLVGYYYDGEGIGTTSFLLDAVDAVGDERDSDGWYLQARYRLPMGTLLGASVGESNLDETAWDRANRAHFAALAPDHEDYNPYNLVESNESWILGLYHPIGEALNLVVEYTETEAEAHNGWETEEETLAIGAIMFF